MADPSRGRGKGGKEATQDAVDSVAKRTRQLRVEPKVARMAAMLMAARGVRQMPRLLSEILRNRLRDDLARARKGHARRLPANTQRPEWGSKKHTEQIRIDADVAELAEELQQLLGYPTLPMFVSDYLRPILSRQLSSALRSFDAGSSG